MKGTYGYLQWLIVKASVWCAAPCLDPCLLQQSGRPVSRRDKEAVSIQCKHFLVLGDVICVNDTSLGMLTESHTWNMSRSSNISPVTSSTGTEDSNDIQENAAETPSDRSRTSRRRAMGRSPVSNQDQDSEDIQPSEDGSQRSSPLVDRQRRSEKLRSKADKANAADEEEDVGPPAASTRSKKKDKLEKKKKLCKCNGKVQDDRTIVCANLDCEKQWWHWKCVKLEAEPERQWLCGPCGILPACYTRYREDQE